MASNSAFTDQILSERLAKLNNSQQSIETLSHWCIFHRKRATQVVNIWQRDFLASPTEKKISFLYLANDILQNSRKKGPEFVNEFWKVLPGVIKDALDKGEENMLNIIKRLIGIWEQRKVFGTKEIKEELLPDPPAAPASVTDVKQKPVEPTIKLPEALSKIAAELRAVEAAEEEDEDALAKVNEVINEVHSIERLLEDRAGNGHAQQHKLTGDLQRQRTALARCIARLEVAETRRSTLVSSLQELLNGKEAELERVRTQLQIAQAQAEQAASVEQRILQGTAQGNVNGKGHVHMSAVRNGPAQHTSPPPAQPQPPAPSPSLKRNMSNPKDREPKLPPRQELPPPPPPPPPFEPEQKTSPVRRPPGFSSPSESVPATRTAGHELAKPTPPSSAAAAADMAAKLAATPSSVSMLSSVLSTLAAESGSASLASALMNVSSAPSKSVLADPETLAPDKRRKTMTLEEAVGTAMGGRSVIGGYDTSYLSPPPPLPMGRAQLPMMGASGMGGPSMSGQGLMGMQSGQLGLGHVPAWTHIPAVPSGPPPAYTPYQPPPPMNYYNQPPSSLQ